VGWYGKWLKSRGRRQGSGGHWCFGALYASRVTAATLHDLVRLPAAPGVVQRLRSRPPAARTAVTHAAEAGTAGGLNDVLLAAAASAALGAIAGFAFGPDPASQPPAIPAPGQLSCQVGPHPLSAQRPDRPEATAL
jgi:hypothetical protein